MLHPRLWIWIAFAVACTPLAGCDDSSDESTAPQDARVGQMPDGATPPPPEDAAGVDALDPDATEVPGDGAPDGAAVDAAPDATPDDAAADVADPDAAAVPPPDGAVEPPPPPPDLGRGLTWVRTHPMFISGLVVRMGPPPPAEVARYFDDFAANAVQLWQRGVPVDMDAWRAARPGAPFVAWTRDDGTSGVNGEVIGGYAANTPGRIGWQVGDEPRTMEAFEALTPGLRAVRAADPDGLLILNFTFHAEELLGRMIERFATEFDGDVISYDRYTRSRSVFETIGLFRTEALQYGLPYWRYLNAYTDERQEPWEPSALRWDAFIGLLFGYTGHTWFVYQVSSPPEEGLQPLLFDAARWGAAPTALFDEVAQLNREMANYGRTITQLTSTDVRYVAGLAGLPPLGIAEWAVGAGEDPYITALIAVDAPPLQELAVGYFTDDAGERYVMVQNQNHAGASFPNESELATGVEVRFDFAGAPMALDRTQVEVLDRTTGRVERVELGGAGEARTFRARLEAGEPVFFKYATGRPFVMGR